MKILLLTAGSRGDVQPFVALAQAVCRAGHTVLLAAPPDAEILAEEHGIPYASLGIDYQALASSDNGRGAVAGRPAALIRSLREVKEATRGMLDAAWTAAKGADAVVYHPKCLAGAHIAEALRIPCFLALPLPLLVPTRTFPAPIGSLPDIKTLNPTSYAAMRLSLLPFSSTLSRWRQEVLGLPARFAFADPFAIGGRPIPVLYAFSRHLVPPPSDWPSHVTVTGYWFTDHEESLGLPADLERFLAAGPPPVYIGFGSMTGRDPEKLTQTIVDAVRLAGVRAVIATGWGGLAASEGASDVYVIRSASHTELFPRCAAVVHHGGSGTTHAGLRAGRPTIVCPVAMDQPFWGVRVQAAGAGPEPIPHRALTGPDGAGRLASAIRTAISDSGIGRAASDLGVAISQEHGVQSAIGVIESVISEWHTI
jgi:sterol 3beta-glucosyltransferase